PELAPFDVIVRRASAEKPADRYPTAAQMADAVERVVGVPLASPTEVSDWVNRLGTDLLDQRAQMVAHVERSSTRSKPPPQSARSSQNVAGADIAAAINSSLHAAGVSSGSLRTANPASSGSLRAAALGAAGGGVKSSGTYTSKTARAAIAAAEDAAAGM